MERTYHNIKATVKLASGGEFSIVFDAAYKAFAALHEYLKKETRTCYYTGHYDELIELCLKVRYGDTLVSECSLFKLEAVDALEDI